MAVNSQWASTQNSTLFAQLEVEWTEWWGGGGGGGTTAQVGVEITPSSTGSAKVITKLIG